MNAKILSLVCFSLDSLSTVANSVDSNDISLGEETETQKGKMIDSRTQSVKGLGLTTLRVISGHSSYMA